MDPQHPTNTPPDTGAGDAAYPFADRAPEPPDGAEVHPLDPEADAAGDPLQAAVRTLLRTTPDPGPMPDDLTRRIEESLARAAVQRAGDHELFDELGFGEPSATTPVDQSNDIIVFPAPTTADDDDDADPGRDLTPRRRWRLVGVAAAGVAVLAIAGGLVVNQVRSGSNGLASIPPQSTGAAAGAVHVQVSSTAYTKSGLVAGAQALVASPGPDASIGDAPSAGPLVTQTGAAACVAALGASDAGAVSIDLATYEGQPAAIVVVQRTDSTAVYAVQRDCGDGDAGIIQDAVPVP